MPANFLTSPLISIVDDDGSVLVAMELLVSSLGFETCIFPSAESFFQSPDLHATDCLFPDVHMPNMSGIELQRVLRAQGRDIPTILMTAFSNENVRVRALAGGAVCFLIKPFDSKTLLACIRAALNRC